MDNNVLRPNDGAHAQRRTGGGGQGENMGVERGTVKLFVLMLSMWLVTAAARADAVLDWNTIAVNTAVANKQNPFAQARYAAIVQLAVFEAVSAIAQDYRPYTGSIAAPPGASAEAAAIEAAYKVLSTYFPDPATQAALLADRTSSLGLIADSQAKTDGIAAGDAAAMAIIALRANDHSSPAQFKIPGQAVPGEWQATAGCPIVNGIAVGIAYQWQNITPFGISNASEFLLGPPPALTSNEYATTYNEGMTVGGTDNTDRPPDRAEVVLYYQSSSPPQVCHQAP